MRIHQARTVCSPANIGARFCGERTECRRTGKRRRRGGEKLAAAPPPAPAAPKIPNASVGHRGARLARMLAANGEPRAWLRAPKVAQNNARWSHAAPTAAKVPSISSDGAPERDQRAAPDHERGVEGAVSGAALDDATARARVPLLGRNCARFAGRDSASSRHFGSRRLGPEPRPARGQALPRALCAFSRAVELLLHARGAQLPLALPGRSQRCCGCRTCRCCCCSSAAWTT